MEQPASRRYVWRRLVTCGACGLAMTCTRPLSVCKPYAYLDDARKGHAPLPCGRVEQCPSRRGPAERLDSGVWHARCQVWRTPAVMPHLQQTWAQATHHHLAALTAQPAPLLQRQQRLERQSQR
jgi:hypothetical protein